MSLLLNRPADIIHQADRKHADFLFVTLDANSGKRLPSGDEIFTGMLARTKKLNELMNDVSDASSESQADKFIAALSNQVMLPEFFFLPSQSSNNLIPLFALLYRTRPKL